MITLLLLLVLLPLLVLGSLPTWPYSAKWTYVPSATLGAATVSLLLLILAGRI
jgi:hypothetical protein